MGLPSQPVTLTAEQIGELNRKLSDLRHDVNNSLSLVLAAVELIRLKPQMTERLAATVADQAPKITETMAKFSREFETTFGITRP